ncbi:MAG: methyltransferase domain-containing protein [Pseudonocardiaceae bacterium]
MMPETLAAEWQTRAHQLAEELVAAGKLRSPEWIDSIEAVPRHVFTPDVLRRDPDGSWHRLDHSTPGGRREWLDRVYSNTALLTATTEEPESSSLRSSSSMPGLMTRMLESLDIQDGHRVLEIGTGTGYNVGLLSRRLGDANVFSVDIEPDLVGLARARLADLGYHPTLRIVDGADGLAECAPFDRIIATCAVPAIPWPWVEQTRLGGVILTDLKPARGAGSLVRLVRGGDGAEGRFDPVYAAFMDLRQQHAPQPSGGRRPAKDRSGTSRQRLSTLDPNTPWNSLLVWFLASFDLGPDINIGYCRPDDSGRPTASSITAVDGSWAEVTLADDDGAYEVIEGGPRSVWRLVEATHETWTNLGRPGWERFGLTVTQDRQVVWFDTPSSAHQWPLVGSRSR